MIDRNEWNIVQTIRKTLNEKIYSMLQFYSDTLHWWRAEKLRDKINQTTLKSREKERNICGVKIEKVMGNKLGHLAKSVSYFPAFDFQYHLSLLRNLYKWMVELYSPVRWMILRQRNYELQRWLLLLPNIINSCMDQKRLYISRRLRVFFHRINRTEGKNPVLRAKWMRSAYRSRFYHCADSNKTCRVFFFSWTLSYSFRL